MLHTGEVLAPMDGEVLNEVIERVKDANVDAVAVCLLHSYANPAHEQAIGDAIRRELPDIPVSLSHEIVPEFKEYERMSTTTINAYVAPVMERYLRRLEQSIADVGLKSDLYIMQSNGGDDGRGDGYRASGSHDLVGACGGRHRRGGNSAAGGEAEQHLDRHGRHELRTCRSRTRERYGGHRKAS